MPVVLLKVNGMLSFCGWRGFFVCCVGMASGLDSLAALRVVSPVLGSPRFNGVGALTAGSEAVMGRCSR